VKTQAQAVVIGGGIVGCSVLYHLTKHGWTDVLLIERSELTSGSSWHAAGGFFTLNSDPNMAKLQGYTIQLYKELEKISGQSCGLHHTGGVIIATDTDRMDYLTTERARFRHIGLDAHLLGPDEIKEMAPITNIDGVIGGLYDPLDGYLDPVGATHAYAKAARIQGAEISLRNRVLELNRRSDGDWDVVTEQGTVVTGHVVNAGGLWAREVGHMAGVYLPLMPMEHQYLVTDDIPEIVALDKELPGVADPGDGSYLRQEGRGLVIGIYEQDCEPWSVDGTPWDFGSELLPDKLDRIAEPLEHVYHRFPCLAEAGIKTVINGPFTSSPDGNPLVGPVPGLPGFWVACAVLAGFSQGGGIGKTLAEWMIEGEPSIDVFAMDVARFGDWCTPDSTRLKVIENYQRRFAVSFPNEELRAARELITTPAYKVWKGQNAVFGVEYGLEAVNYFAPEGEPTEEKPSFRRSNAHDPVGAECRAVRTKVGINEIHDFGKYEVTGPGAEQWLAYVLAGRIPVVGRLSLSPLLTPKGRLIGDLIVSRIASERFQITGSSVFQAFHMRWFEQHLPEKGVEIRNVSLERIGFQIAGPNAREVLALASGADVSAEAMPFLSVTEMPVGGVPATVNRVSFTGDLGYEINVDAEDQLKLHKALMAAGGDLGLTPFGNRAMLSLRLEKSFGSWLREYRPDYTPGETGLDRFISFKKGDFIGRDAAERERDDPGPRKLVAMVVEAEDADVWADEPIWRDGEVVGFVTSGGYAHYVEKSVALGFVPREMAGDGEAFEIEILGHRRPAKITAEPLFDPNGSRMRG
jgi:dimethylglycine dehydrogenase